MGTITVLGATGNTGRAVTLTLLREGHQVRALGRGAGRLAPLGEAGAEVRVGDPTDVGYLTEAFRGVDAVYTLLPNDPTWPDFRARTARLGTAVVAAAAAAEVGHLVALSSLGAESSMDTGLVTTLHDQEVRLRTLVGTNVLLLRPGLFFESFLPVLAGVRHEGRLTDVVAPEVAVPMVASRDVAAVAAAALSTRDWEGVAVREVLGPRDLTYPEVASILGAAVGQPDLPYLPVPYADMAAGLVAAGMSEEAADLHVRLGRALNEGRVASQGRTSAATTPTDLTDFAPTLAEADRAVPA
ncbi:NmrA family NAD(P)-binding protein [Actinophytocola xanthii]|uniref:NmrA-like domain-containing protein n=1 Tax=Actinophytocola xanthii TaxID=1912961 RepID=A0A1Q8CDZ1_9PSEU|nr:NAD(P)H-binding protein [Actinophytocola xanthii]OLF12573.1 hypothetical protein BU204_28425 [Actinophytocola xanthii]